MDAFTQAYIEALLWSSSGDHGSPLGKEANVSEISPELMSRIESDCKNFQLFNSEHFDGDYKQAGHDFALTRNRVGTGFWDGDWPEPAATLLTDAARAVGELELYRGDDGLIYAL
jgi:hypothetical protein